MTQTTVHQKHATLVMGPPSRLPYVQATMRQLNAKCVPGVCWSRTPDPEDLKNRPVEIKSKQRVMVIWFTTVLGAVKEVCDRTGCTGVLVMEDTFLLRPDVVQKK